MDKTIAQKLQILVNRGLMTQAQADILKAKLDR